MFRQNRFLVAGGTRPIIERGQAGFLQPFVEKTQVNTHRTSPRAGATVHAPTRKVKGAYDVIDVVVGWFTRIAHIDRALAINETLIAIAKRASIAAGIAARAALGDALEELPALLCRESLYSSDL